jgi:hypothetical protein
MDDQQRAGDAFDGDLAIPPGIAPPKHVDMSEKKPEKERKR